MRRLVPIEVVDQILGDHARERELWSMERKDLLDRLSEALGRGLPAAGRRVRAVDVPDEDREAHMLVRDVGQMP